jgi:hypothetical protein
MNQTQAPFINYLQQPYYGPQYNTSQYTYIQNGFSEAQDSLLYSQPLVFTNQIYPKMPWYPKTGMPCGSGCGATGTCSKNGVCMRRPSTGTVFAEQVTYRINKPLSMAPIEKFGDDPNKKKLRQGF